MVSLAAAILLGHALLVSATCPLNPLAQVEAIKVWAGALIDGIVFEYPDHSESVFGDQGGTYKGSFTLQPGEYLESVTGIQGDTLHVVQFHTSRNRSSQEFRGAMPINKAFDMVAPPGHHIVGLLRDPSRSAYGCCGVITNLITEPEETHMVLRSIQVRSGLLIDQIAFTFADGNRSEFPPLGSAGGSYSGEFALHEDEYLTRITGYQGNSLFTLQVHTSQNRSSKLFGIQTNPDAAFNQVAPRGHEITGLVRSSGAGCCGNITICTNVATIPAAPSTMAPAAHDWTITETTTAAPIATAPVVAPIVSAVLAAALLCFLAAVAVLCRRRLLRSRGNGSGDGTEAADCDVEGGIQGLPVPDHGDDPAYAAVTLEQLNDLRKLAKQEFGDEYANATMYDIGDRIVLPLCSKHRKCYAHIVNGSELKHVDIFVSHAWAENFDEFVQSVNVAFQHWMVKPTLWICALALVQSTDPAVIAAQVGTGEDPFNAPFSKALSEADKMLVVRNSTVNLYDRIWCCWELFVAHRLSLVDKPGGLMVTGRCRSRTDQRVDIAAAKAFNLEDKRRILSYVLSAQAEYQAINDLLTEIWHTKLDVDEDEARRGQRQLRMSL